MTKLTPGGEYDEIEVVKTDYSSQKLQKLRIASSQFQGAVLANTDFTDSSFRSVGFRDCDLTGTLFIGVRLEDVVFTNCKLHLSSFMFAKLMDVRIENCYLKDTDFRDTRLQDILFDGSTFEETNFSGANTAGRIDIRAAQIISAPGIEQLKNLVISQEQLLYFAPLLAKNAGIIIED